MSKMPIGWTDAVGEDLFSSVRGVTYSKSDATSSPGDGLVPILRANNIEGGEIVANDLVYVPSKYVSHEQFLKAGDLLIASSSGSRTVVGKTARADECHAQFAFGAFCTVARPRTEEFSKWLFSYTRSHAYREYVERVALGISINNLRGSDLKAMPITIAPLPEQRRIVTKIDSLTGKSKRARDQLDHIPRLVEKYKEAVLTAAFRGDLTREWREHTEPSEAWQRVLWEDAGTTLNGRAFPSRDYAAEGVKLLRPGNLHKSGRLEWSEKNTRFLPHSYAEQHPEHFIRGCEIVVNLTAQSLEDQFLGRVCLSSDTDGFLLNQRIALFRPHSMNRKYCLYALKAPSFRAFVDNGLNSGSLIQHVHTKQLMRFVFNVAPQDEQTEIVRRIESAFSWIDRLASEATSARRLIDHLDQAVLNKAFRGELVPQDPADEPASVLLERIRTERNATPKAKRGRKVPG